MATPLPALFPPFLETKERRGRGKGRERKRKGSRKEGREEGTEGGREEGKRFMPAIGPL